MLNVQARGHCDEHRSTPPYPNSDGGCRTRIRVTAVRVERGASGSFFGSVVPTRRPTHLRVEASRTTM